MPRQSLGATVRSVFFWFHLVLGISAGALIMLMSVTGVMLGFERQMIGWIDGKPRAEVPANPVRLELDSLFSVAGIDRAGVASVVVKAAPHEPVLVRFRERGATPKPLDPYTGAVLAGASGTKGQEFFSALRRWHRYVGAEAAEARATGKLAAGVANLVFLFIVLSGLYLWWPRRWSRQAVRATTVPSVSLSGKARDFNWHNVAGFWSAIPLALIVASGVFISFRWPGQWLDRIAGSESEKAAAIAAMNAPAAAPAAAGASATRERAPDEPAPVRVGDAPLAAWFNTAATARPAWQQVTITMPAPRDSTATLAVAEGNTYRPDLRYTLLIDPVSAAVRETRDYGALSTARQIRAWVRFGHTGEVFGIWGQIFATIFTAAGALLVWTGFALSWRRLRAWWRRRGGSAPVTSGAL
jgi:uncharacterized iron-regulated membrane protein